MSKSNPFKPGLGLLPPYLAGRGQEQQLLSRRLETMANGDSVNVVVMYGPRGMGKTALLGWLQEQCAERKIRYIKGTPASMLSSIDTLARTLLPVSWRPKDWPTSLWPGNWRLGLGGAGVSAQVGAGTRGGIEGVLAKRLITRCRRNPLVVLLDEAHDPSDPDTLRLFLHTVQEVAQQSPFLLVLAGTPQLDATLRNARATFIERAKSVGLGRLDEEAAAAAISVPLEEDGITIANNALEKAAEDSHGYPFFIQQWGAMLWDHATKKGATELTEDDADSVMTHVQTEKAEFYSSRYRAIQKPPELLAAAQALAKELLAGRQNLNMASLAGLIQDNIGGAASPPDDAELQNKVQTIIEELTRQDFLWQPPASELMVPGIPSFLTYINDRA